MKELDVNVAEKAKREIVIDEAYEKEVAELPYELVDELVYVNLMELFQGYSINLKKLIYVAVTVTDDLDVIRVVSDIFEPLGKFEGYTSYKYLTEKLKKQLIQSFLRRTYGELDINYNVDEEREIVYITGALEDEIYLMEFPDYDLAEYVLNHFIDKHKTGIYIVEDELKEE